jgi:2-dehydro-3-deoxygluconokinase
MAPHPVVAIGECMLELSRVGKVRRLGDGWRLGYAGDTFNTAFYLRHLGVPVAYMTALGIDAYSMEMREAWIAAGIDVSLVLVDEQRLPGLYAISTAPDGERSFNYWRSDSAARRLFALRGIEAALNSAAQAELLYLSGITLSLFGATERARLLQLAQDVRQRGGQVAFDPNYRPRGWSSAAAAREAVEAFAPAVSVALPTADDEALLWGESTPAQIATRWLDWGAAEVVVKRGADGCVVTTRAASVAVAAIAVPAVVDTTGAGDSFNAAYLAARRAGRDVAEAGAAGNRLAAQVVQRPGALLQDIPEWSDQYR